GPIELEVDRVVGQPGMPILARDYRRQHRSNRTVDVADRSDEADTLTAFDCRPTLLNQLMVKRTRDSVILLLDDATSDVRRHVRLVEDPAEVQTARFPMFYAHLRFEQVGTSDQVLESPNAELRHQLADLLGNEEEVVNDVLVLAREFGSQHRILRGNADGTGVQVALAHHDAALDDQRRGREAEFVGAQQSTDHDIAAGLHLSVRSEGHT